MSDQDPQEKCALEIRAKLKFARHAYSVKVQGQLSLPFEQRAET